MIHLCCNARTYEIDISKIYSHNTNSTSNKPNITYISVSKWRLCCMCYWYTSLMMRMKFSTFYSKYFELCVDCVCNLFGMLGVTLFFSKLSVLKQKYTWWLVGLDALVLNVARKPTGIVLITIDRRDFVFHALRFQPPGPRRNIKTVYPWYGDSHVKHFPDDIFKRISWMKMFEFPSQFHWNLFLRVQLTIFQHWFR